MGKKPSCLFASKFVADIRISIDIYLDGGEVVDWQI